MLETRQIKVPKSTLVLQKLHSMSSFETTTKILYMISIDKAQDYQNIRGR